MLQSNYIQILSNLKDISIVNFSLLFSYLVNFIIGL